MRTRLLRCGVLVPGRRLADVYITALKILQEEAREQRNSRISLSAAQLSAHFVRTAGYGTGVPTPLLDTSLDDLLSTLILTPLSLSFSHPYALHPD